MKKNLSANAMQEAKELFPGGVNSPVRAFQSVGGEPVVMESASGPFLKDLDGNIYIDYIGSWGPMIAGHNHPSVVKKIEQQLKKGISFGTPAQPENHLAKEILSRMPYIEKIRMVNSGTEAIMSAIRLARAATGRELIVKFDGGYHGHSDSVLVEAGSGISTLGLPDSPGVPRNLAEKSISVAYNDNEAIQQVFEEKREEIACVVVEPIAGNMGCIPARSDFLKLLRFLTTKYSALLIFDEVMTGFRVGTSGAQGLYDIQPDLTVLGKIIGGGLPVGAFGGKRHLMREIAPDGPVYQAGTLSGNPLAMTAGLATLELLTEETYSEIWEQTQKLASGFEEIAESHSVKVSVTKVCGMFSIFFTKSTPRNFLDVKASDIGRFNRFFHSMLNQGIYFGPSAYEAAFVSAAHNEDTTKKTLQAADKAFAELGQTKPK